LIEGLSTSVKLSLIVQSTAVGGEENLFNGALFCVRLLRNPFFSFGRPQAK
jgi:hypothetical protein